MRRLSIEDKIFPKSSLEILAQLFDSCGFPSRKFFQAIAGKRGMRGEIAFTDLKELFLNEAFIKTLEEATWGREKIASRVNLLRAFCSPTHAKIIEEIWREGNKKMTLEDEVMMWLGSKLVRLTLAEMLFLHTLLPMWLQHGREFYMFWGMGNIILRGVEIKGSPSIGCSYLLHAGRIITAPGVNMLTISTMGDVIRSSYPMRDIFLSISNKGGVIDLCLLPVVKEDKTRI